MERDEYARAYAAGYADGLAVAQNKRESPVLSLNDVQERYKVGLNKAHEIIRAIRHVSNGGKLGCSSLVLLSEAEYWESLVDKTFRERL